MSFKNYYNELKRRNVFKGALAYILFSWILIQVFSILLSTFEAPSYIMKIIVVLLLVSFPVWIIFSWVYEITPEGIKKTKNVHPEYSTVNKTNNRLNYIIIGALMIAIILLGVNAYATYNTNGASLKETQFLEQATSISKPEYVVKSVAVLAFSDMSPKNDQEYFSDGISEEILNYLAKNPELKVLSRTSSFYFKGKEATTTEIGEKLNVNYILEGSVRKAGEVLRITAQLINVKDGLHLWSETYDRKMNDIFAIQDEIAQEVTKNLEANLLNEKIKEANTEAYTKYLEAKNVYERYTKEGNVNALRLVKESIAIDASYAPAWLLQAKIIRYGYGYINSKELFDKDKIMPALQIALKLDSSYAIAYAYMGDYYVSLETDYVKARQNYQQALTLDSENAEVLRRVSNYPTISQEDRIKLLKKAIQIDPLDELNFLRLSSFYIYSREYKKALEAMDKYLLFSNYVPSDHAYRAEILALLGQQEEAMVEIEQETDDISKRYTRALIALIFKEKDSEKYVNSYKEKFASEYPYTVAQMYAYQNKKDSAYVWLQKAFDKKDINILAQFREDPYMDPLREDAQFKKFMSKVDFPEPLELNFIN
ncbi:TolB amino-terminal domain-containing protein [Flaviramulus basaltis]|uniref:TolB amino-terminal domain-containing protein n=1 Tax=Flaviramulus basaltis TaxID=369401 RepID=A0A1K2IIK4_9FLAO|nr:hypothetical protein [Flaviramulus basaltis]SFZ92231.1 TolB amino-terminal domain-containing protein [Flaviramulus basaltis]